MEPEETTTRADEQEVDALPIRITVEIGNKLVGGNAYGEAHALGFMPLNGSGKVCRHQLVLAVIPSLTMLVESALRQAVESGDASPREGGGGNGVRLDA